MKRKKYRKRTLNLGEPLDHEFSQSASPDKKKSGKRSKKKKSKKKRLSNIREKRTLDLGCPGFNALSDVQFINHNSDDTLNLIRPLSPLRKLIPNPISSDIVASDMANNPVGHHDDVNPNISPICDREFVAIDTPPQVPRRRLASSFLSPPSHDGSMSAPAAGLSRSRNQDRKTGALQITDSEIEGNCSEIGDLMKEPEAKLALKKAYRVRHNLPSLGMSKRVQMKGCQKITQPVRMKYSLNIEHVHKAMVVIGCCCVAPRLLDVEMVVSARVIYADKKHQDQVDWVFNEIQRCTVLDEVLPQHIWNNNQVCSECFCDIHGISRYMYCKYFNAVRNGIKKVVSMRELRQYSSPVKDAMVAWMNQYFNEIGENDVTTGNQNSFIDYVVVLVVRFTYWLSWYGWNILILIVPYF